MPTATSVHPAPPRGRPDAPTPRRGRVGPVVVAVLAVAIVLVSVATYASGPLDEVATSETGGGLAAAYAVAAPVFQGALYVHIVTACVALLLGPVQLSARLRRRALSLHRVLGRVYLVAIGAGALSGLLMLPVNSAGIVGWFGFGTLAVLWALTGWRAYSSIRAGDVAAHRAWMLRSYALTFAAVTLRLWLGVLIGIQVPFAGPEPDVDALFANAYPAVPFLCWLPNLVVAEHLIRRRGLPAYRLTAV